MYTRLFRNWISFKLKTFTSYLMVFPNFDVSYLNGMEWVASILNIYIMKCYIEFVKIQTSIPVENKSCLHQMLYKRKYLWKCSHENEQLQCPFSPHSFWIIEQLTKPDGDSNGSNDFSASRKSKPFEKPGKPQSLFIQ